MLLWSVVVIDKIVSVQVYDEKNKHTEAVFSSKVGACGFARRKAKENGLTFIGDKVKWTD